MSKKAQNRESISTNPAILEKFQETLDELVNKANRTEQTLSGLEDSIRIQYHYMPGDYKFGQGSHWSLKVELRPGQI